MKKNNYYIILILLFLVCAGTINNSYNTPKIEITKQQSAFNVNSDFLKIFSIGQTRLLASLLWVSTLLESDIDQFKEKNLNSWMFLRFKSIIQIDPQFLRAYQFGGKYLDIVKDDLEGARYIFKKGLDKFPNDYDLLFNYGFLLAFELNEYAEAVTIYKRVLKSSMAPEYIKSLIPKLIFEKDKNLEDIFPIVYDLYQKEPENSFLKQKLEKDLYAIKAEIDLKCLNSKEVFNCSKIDFYGNLYKKEGDKFISPSFPFIKYQLFKTD